MTKKELEKENNFLKLQLNKIADLVNRDNLFANDDELAKTIGHITHYSNSYKEKFDFIKKFDLPYDFYEIHVLERR